MPRIVTTKKKARGAAKTAGAGDRAIRAASIAVVAACAAVAAWRLLAPAGGDGPASQELAGPDAGRGRQTRISRETPASHGAGVASTRQRKEPKEPGNLAPRKRADPQPGPTGHTPSGSGSDAASPAAPLPPAAPPPPAPAPANREREFFDNSIENTIASVSEPGAEFLGFPPLDPDMEDSEIIAILKRPVVIEEDDDEATVAAKERTAEFKTKALEAMESGLTFAQFIRDLVALRNEQAAMREDARSEMLKILRKDGEPAAREYLKIVNRELAAQGMKELSIPPFALEEYRKEH